MLIFAIVNIFPDFNENCDNEWKIYIKVHHQLEAIQQMTVFAGGMLMLGLNILMFGTLFLLIRVIQRMNKFEKVSFIILNVRLWVIDYDGRKRPLIGLALYSASTQLYCLVLIESLYSAEKLSNTAPIVSHPCKTLMLFLVHGSPTAAASSIHGPKWKQLLFTISSSNNANGLGYI